ncbi:hypothetical protein [Shewanella sp.]|uniref:hypothetical protein n=1 Tax=Shewanella sp. TaxID=50422 RepID=UPI00258B51A6|nr:hypothetical protein [Shewanella sp.]MCJ8301364.1 hypothetical protein [Shewanella sp.]
MRQCKLLFSVIGITGLCSGYVATAHATSIANDIELIFPPKGIVIEHDVEGEPLYKSVGLDVKMQDGEAVYTLNASVDIGETWRMFGEYDSNEFWEVGVGKSFYTSFMFTEVTAKANSVGYSAGIFTGIPISETIILMADTNYNWYTEEFSFGFDLGDDYQGELGFTPSDTVDIMLGVSWSAHERLNVSYSYNHVYDTRGGNSWVTVPELDIDERCFLDINCSKGNFNYHDITLTTQIWKFSPYFTYTYFADRENLYEFGLVFKW